MTTPTILKRRRRSGGAHSWLVILGDLLALLLAFFVLLYSMSTIDLPNWSTISDSLEAPFAPLKKATRGKEGADRNVARRLQPPAADLGYLEAVISEKFRNDALLAVSRVRRLDDRLVISLPSARIFAAGSAEFGQSAKPSLETIAGLLGSIGNSIGVEGHTDSEAEVLGNRFSSRWELSLVRAITVANLLSELGVRREILTNGYADSRFYDISSGFGRNQRNQLARRVDIVIREGSDIGE